MLYSGSHSWHCVLLKMGTTASCNTLATLPGDQKQTAYTWPSKRLLTQIWKKKKKTWNRMHKCVYLTIFRQQSPTSNKTLSPFFNLCSRIWEADGLNVIWKKNLFNPWQIWQQNMYKSFYIVLIYISVSSGAANNCKSQWKKVFKMSAKNVFMFLFSKM